MHTDQAETTVIAHCGYGDDYRRLWRYRSGVEETIPIGLEDGFHLYGDSDRTLVLICAMRRGEPWTVRPTSDVERIVASATWDGGAWEFSGDSSVWSSLPRWVVVRQDKSERAPDDVWLSEDADRSGLVQLAPGPQPVDPLSWYWRGTYDHLYQGLHHPVAVPGTDLIVFGVQRSGELVLYDPAHRRVVRNVPLADRGGNPDPYMRRLRPEAWAIDYDTLVRVDVNTWQVVGKRKLQDPAPGLDRNFAGRLWFPFDEQFCLVARPFSGDVLIIDPLTLETVDAVAIGTQPLDAVIVGGQLVARDWNPRTLHTAPLPPPRT